MKKVFLLIFVVTLFSCNNDDDNDNNSNLANYLLSKRTTNTSVFTGLNYDEYIRYEYNENNHPIKMYSNITNIDYGGIEYLKLEYDYNHSSFPLIIKENYMNFNYISNSLEISHYLKISFSVFNGQEALGNASLYDHNDNLIEENKYGVHIVFDGLLIKSIKFNGGYNRTKYFTHDSEGKLLSISNELPAPQNQSVIIHTWDNNPKPDLMNYLKIYERFSSFWFPNHYISTKNPSSFYAPFDEDTHIDNEYEIINEYDAFGNTTKNTSINSNPNTNIENRETIKEYIPAN